MLKIYNTLTKQQEEFHPINPGKVGIYACGPTVYGYIHIGNIRAYLTADILRRYLTHRGYEVRLIKNITDVGHLTQDDIAQGDSGEDKIVAKAAAEKKTPEELARFYENYFKETEEKLNILPAHYYPRATEHIPHMIKMIAVLIAKGHAYEKNGNVFFDVTSFPDYGKLSGNTLAQLKVGARLERHPDKKNPWDFALWLKAPREHVMQWDSPWSRGYPGWHIECSAMSMEYLGDSFDIHTGGEDNIFPHHEAEIAQSECASGKPFVRYWVHTRHLLVDGEKMSKSKGNFYTLEDVVAKGYTPMDLRLSMLLSHHAANMNFTWERMEQAKENRWTIERFTQRLASYAASATERDQEKIDVALVRKEFENAMDDGLNTPFALSVLFTMITKGNVLMDEKRLANADDVRAVFDKMMFVFGMVIADTKEPLPKDVLDLAAQRERARKEKDFSASDRLRDELRNRGYAVEDTPDGPVVRKI